MTEFISTATMQRDDGSTIFVSTRRERSKSDTQARKAASRYWGGVARERGWQLQTLYCVNHSPAGYQVAERPHEERVWTTYLAPQAPSIPVNACITALGGEPPTQPPPESLTINGWHYHRGAYIGNV